MKEYISGLVESYRLVILGLLAFAALFGFIFSAACTQNLGSECDLRAFWLDILLEPEVLAALIGWVLLPFWLAFYNLCPEDPHWLLVIVLTFLGAVVWGVIFFSVIIGIFIITPDFLAIAEQIRG